MKRVLVLVLVGGLLAGLVFVPAFRKAFLRNSRFVLLILSGAILLAGTLRLVWPAAGPPLTGGERAGASIALLILGISALSVLRDVLKR